MFSSLRPPLPRVAPHIHTDSSRAGNTGNKPATASLEAAFGVSLDSAGALAVGPVELDGEEVGPALVREGSEEPDMSLPVASGPKTGVSEGMKSAEYAVNSSQIENLTVTPLVQLVWYGPLSQ